MSRHRHRCLRCDQEFDCQTPDICIANHDVLPSIVTVGANGLPRVTQHCAEGPSGTWTPVPEFSRVADDVAEDVPIGKRGPYGTHTNGDGSPVAPAPRKTATLAHGSDSVHDSVNKTHTVNKTDEKSPAAPTPERMAEIRALLARPETHLVWKDLAQELLAALDAARADAERWRALGPIVASITVDKPYRNGTVGYYRTPDADDLSAWIAKIVDEEIAQRAPSGPKE